MRRKVCVETIYVRVNEGLDSLSRPRAGGTAVQFITLMVN